MGELAASIAHEINQPLTAVVNNGNAALRWLARDTPNLAEAEAALKDIVKEGTRASEVIGRIRGLLRHDKQEYVELDVNGAIREVVALTMGAMQSRGIAVQTSLAARLPHALGDRVQLQQVVMNLIMNGADAMSCGDRPASYLANSIAARRIRRCAGQRQGFRNRDRRSDTAPGVRSVVHDQVHRHGHGSVDLPVDRRSPWRAPLGFAMRAAWHRVSVHRSERHDGNAGRRVMMQIKEHRAVHNRSACAIRSANDRSNRARVPP